MKNNALLFTFVGLGLAGIDRLPAQVQQAWVARTGSIFNALKVDSAGNAYVTGWNSATMKYDSNGNQLWAAPSGIALALDGARNVFVTDAGNQNCRELCEQGQCFYDCTYDFMTASYGGNGSLRWQALYDGRGNRVTDYPNAMVADSEGNIYVTGVSVDWRCLVLCNSEGCSLICDGNPDYATVKYDASGNQVWVARYDGGGDDVPRAMAVDNIGNVYVSGSTTVKYGRNGRQLWLVTQEYYNHANTIAVDSRHNVYVTGGYSTVKYDSNGNRLWVGRGGSTMAVDSSGHVYVSDFLCGDITCFYETVKYDNNGNQVWVATYESSPDYSPGTATVLALDDSGNVYVSGSSTGSSTVKYDPSGKQLWAVQCPGPAAAIALDTEANIYIAGSLRAEGFLVKYTQRPRLMLNAMQPNSHFRFTLVGEAGRNYTIQVSMNLTTWTALTNFTSATGTNEFTDPAGPNNFSRRFYRAVSP